MALNGFWKALEIEHTLRMHTAAVELRVAFSFFSMVEK